MPGSASHSRHVFPAGLLEGNGRISVDITEQIQVFAGGTVLYVTGVATGRASNALYVGTTGGVGVSF